MKCMRRLTEHSWRPSSSMPNSSSVSLFALFLGHSLNARPAANKRKPDAVTTNGDDNCTKKSEEGDEGEPEEDDGQLVEKDSQQGEETQLCEFEDGRAGTGTGSSDNGEWSGLYTFLLRADALV